MKWHNYPEELPDRSGDYLVMLNIDEEQKKAGDGRPFGAVEVGQFYVEGDKIEIHSLKFYEDLPPEERLLKSITDPYTVTSIGAFYEVPEDLIPYVIHDVTHWAELPKVPDCYAGNQNDYFEEL